MKDILKTKTPITTEMNTLIEPLTSSQTNDTNETKKPKTLITEPKSISFLSKVFFHWTLPLFSLSNSQKLNFKTITKDNSINPSITTDEIKQSYLRLKKKYNNKNLFLTILITYLKELFFVIFISLLLSILKVYQIRLLGNVIISFKQQNTTSDNGETLNNQYELYYFSFLFLFVKFIQIIINYHNKNLSQILGLRVSSSLNALIYDKILISSQFTRNDINRGEMINFIQSDIETLNHLFFYGPHTLVVPCQILMNIFMLFRIFGPTFIYSILTLGILMTLAWIIQKMYIRNQRNVLKYKDYRIKETTFSLQVIKMIKFFSLEDIFFNKINDKRKNELNSIKKLQNIYVLSGFVFWSVPLVLSIVAIGVYTLIKGSLPIENLIMAIEILDSISYPLYRVPVFVTNLLNTIVSMKRVESFLSSKNINQNLITNKEDENGGKYCIKIRNADFGIDNRNENEICILKNINLSIREGDIIGILGETGSGKTCLVNALLHHFPMLNQGKDNCFTEVKGKISFSSQIPFIINDTIRNNIVFYNTFNSEKYHRVLSICQLNQDIDTFPGKDFTEISSNGTNLSGGQKARINLARAVYNEADIYIFDDPFTSVDSIIAKDIIDKVILDYLKGKTRIVIKHDFVNLDNLKAIIYMEKGTVKWSGTKDDFLNSDIYLKSGKNKKETNSLLEKFINDSMKCTKKNPSISTGEETPKEINSPILSSDSESVCKVNKGKLMKEEEQSKGKVKISLFFLFFKLMGNNSYKHVIIIIILSFLWQFCQIVCNFWLTNWSSLKDKLKVSGSEENLYYFLVFCQIAAFCLFCQFLKEFLISRCLLNVYRILHMKIIRSVIGAPINLFHDVVPLGQIINRISNDLDKCKFIIRQFTLILKAISILMGSIVICYNLNNYSLICVPFLFFIGFSLTSYYINCGRDLNRIESISNSPIINCYNETINGIVSIRAYGKTKNFMKKYLDKIFDHYLVTVFKFGVNCWYSLYLNLLAFIYLAFVVIFACVCSSNFSPGAVGLLLKYSISFTDQMLNVFEEMSNIEKAMVNFERCISYTKITQEHYKSKIIVEKQEEKKKKFTIITPSISFNKVTMRYRPNTDLIYKDLTIKINPFEKIGVVGRSGSGKSSLSNALFRIVELLQGNIEIGGVDISTLPLSELRKEICIVPQDPFLYEASLRENLDPYNKFTNQDIEKVLKEINFFDIEKKNGKNEVGIKMKLEENGNNFSMGEKQLICFARALLQKKKIIIFDEATSNVDKDTEKIVMNLIDKKFTHNATIILISHKLTNVMNCDRVIVMEKGIAIEFDRPQVLYNNTKSMFRKLCDNDKQK